MRIIYFIFSVLTASTLFCEADPQWDDYKKTVLSKMRKMEGWCTQEKAHLIMELLHENKCEKCVEIGVFGGKSLYPILKTLEYNGSGFVYGIDAWNADDALKGFDPASSHATWWKKLDYNHFYFLTVQMILKEEHHSRCCLLWLPSQRAVTLFEEDSIDFIHFDGNSSFDVIYSDMLAYFPKVKDKGFILLNNAQDGSMRETLIFLLERADLISSFKPASFLLFQKNEEKEEKAKNLSLPDENEN